MNTTRITYRAKGPSIVSKRFVQNSKGDYILEYGISNARINKASTTAYNTRGGMTNDFKFVQASSVLKTLNASPSPIQQVRHTGEEALAQRRPVKSNHKLMQILNKPC